LLRKNLAIRQIQTEVAASRLHLGDVVRNYLKTIAENEPLDAFLEVFEEDALFRADFIEAKIRTGRAGPLAGAIVAAKDIIAIKSKRLTCGSKILSDFISPYDATVTRKLLDADAIIIGKTNMDEFAMGSSNENSAFGHVKNPHDFARVPGGSSGGSAVAVAAKLCTAALGSDTGGSIRQPAAFCGVYGLKPTYGRVSRFGLVAFASSLDQIGPFATTAEDLALVLQAIAGQDEFDSTSASLPVPHYLSHIENFDFSSKTIGIPREYLSENLQPEILEKIEYLKSEFVKAGAKVVDISLPLTEYCIAAYYIICTAEASSNLARYDGARYGFRAQNATTLEEMYTKSRSEGFGAEVKRRIMLGTYVLSSGYYDAYYRRALKARTLIRKDFEKAFAKCDLLLTPTTPTTAFQIGEKITDPMAMYLSDIFTVSANLTGLPAISIPAGKDNSGLPIGVQFIGKAFDEMSLLQAARFLESVQNESS
jgi:aspartyl-tRNA(Asn)/glutamyl-tRNA(Gln) amidotransferase subunit A